MSYHFGLRVAQTPDSQIPALVRETASPWVRSWRWRLVLELRPRSAYLTNEARSDFLHGPDATAFALATHTVPPGQLPVTEVARYGTATDLQAFPMATLRAASPTPAAPPGPRLSERAKALIEAIRAENVATAAELLHDPDVGLLRIMVPPLMEQMWRHPDLVTRFVDAAVCAVGRRVDMLQTGPRSLADEWELLLTPWVLADPTTRVRQLLAQGLPRLDFLQGGLSIDVLSRLLGLVGRSTLLERGVTTPEQLATVRHVQRVRAQALAAVLPAVLVRYVVERL